MVKRNAHLAKLHSNYLFPEINKRKLAYLKKNPDAKLISLGIGDTTEPLPEFVSKYMASITEALGTAKGYSGYGPEQGQSILRKLIAEKMYAKHHIEFDEVFVSDGSKCDIGRLQILFGSNIQTAVQDPSYPVYVDTSVILGQTQQFDVSSKHYKGITYLVCNPENSFFPDFSNQHSMDLIYFCSPNNPTGAVATHKQLEKLVSFAKQNRSIIIYDAAYSSFIQDPALPRSIYEIPGSREVAIELGSFSKMIGFTGVRLGWSIVPKELKFDDGHCVHADWNRINSTMFNGASSIAQAGGIAALQPEGQKGMQQLVAYYMENASILCKLFKELNFEVHGGTNAPYLWVKFPKFNSWDAFEHLLEKANVVCTPGSGFGPSGEGFLRFSAFGNRNDILEACERIRSL